MDASEHILLPNSKKDPILKDLRHVRVMRQHMENVCGFHALNNALLLCEAALAESAEEALQRVALMQSRGELWRF